MLNCKRSNAKTTFHMLKSKFDDAVGSKTKVAQVNEVLLKVLHTSAGPVVYTGDFRFHGYKEMRRDGSSKEPLK